MKNTTRRDFLKTSTAVGSFFILPSGLLANSPNGRLCTAHIGTGGKGRVDTAGIAKHKHTQVLGHPRTGCAVVGLGQVTPRKRKRITFSEPNKDVGQQHTLEWSLGPHTDSRQWGKLGQGNDRFRATSGRLIYVGTVPINPSLLREVLPDQ